MSMIVDPSRFGSGAGSDGLDLDTVLSTGWRLVFEETLGANIWIGQVQLRESVGGSNVAIHGSTGTASSPSTINSGFEPEKAFNNGASGDGWSTSVTGVGGAILDFTFDTPRNIKQIALKSPAASTTADFKRLIVQCLLDGTWINMAIHTNETQFGTNETRLYSALVAAVFDVFVGDVYG